MLSPHTTSKAHLRLCLLAHLPRRGVMLIPEHTIRVGNHTNRWQVARTLTSQPSEATGNDTIQRPIWFR